MTYSGEIHKSDLIEYNSSVPWLSPELIKQKTNLNGILNRIHHSTKLVNFILIERDKQVNIYRKKMEKKDELGDIFWYIVLFTESYFVYAKNMLNAWAELIYEIFGNYPNAEKANFTHLWEYAKANVAPNQELHEYFQNKMLWYNILVQEPRNKLVIHDQKTSGYAMNDHGIDVYIGKSPEHDANIDKQAIAELQKIISNHQELKNIQAQNYFHPIYREIIQQIDVLNESEIQLLIDAAAETGMVFPYIPQITPKLQDLIKFVEKLLAEKYQMCPTCKKPNLKVTRIVINPKNLKYDPNNIWFGWLCHICNYRKKFIL